ncbi:MAG: LamG domain-containing protein, partial [Planctomycetia bacterium]|nr:LamG domain-containing protein [Planctomycetia bacterium]
DLSGLTGSRTDNLSTKGKQLLPAAKINNCRLTKGFYDGTAAVLFGEKGSFDFELPGAYRNLTLIASVRVDDIKDRTSILMAGHDFYSASGTFLWQILPNGAIQIQLTPINNRSEQTCFPSEPFTWPCHWKTWSTVAVVLDADKKAILHYYDGRLVAEVPWKTPTPLYIGTASLGNMRRSQFELTPLYLNGAMDDFQIYDKALSSAEIAKIQKVY